MLKKITALGSLLISLLILGFCAEPTKELSVNADGGLRMRESPTLDSKNLALIPNLATVDFIEQGNEEVEIAGKRGHWTKIRFLDKTGWVFGAYLSDTVQSDRRIDLQEVFRNGDSISFVYDATRRENDDRQYLDGDCTAVSWKLHADGRVTGVNLHCSGLQCPYKITRAKWMIIDNDLQINALASTEPDCPGFSQEQLTFRFESFRRDKITLANYSMKSFEINPASEPEAPE